MALLKMGSIVTNISGKVGGQTFGVGRSGQYLKNTGSYINKQTPLRRLQNSRISYLTGIWRTLNQNDRNAWNNVATNFPKVNRVGDSRILSGFNLFVQFNANRIMHGLQVNNNAPAPYSFNQFAMDSYVISDGGMVIDFEVTDVNCFYAIFASNPVSAGASQNLKGLRLMRTFDGLNLSQTIDYSGNYFSTFGRPQKDMRVFIRVYQYFKDSGQKSGYFLDFNDLVTS